jgi:hypothetical protein
MASKKQAASSAAVESPRIEESVVKRQGLPLFYQKPAALEKSRHAMAAVVTEPDLRFARATNSVTINALEFIEAAKHYPIVFTATDEPTPLAILGFEKENYFVDEAGKWREGSYVPAYVRQYPFIFFEHAEEKKFILCIDEKSSQFRSQGASGAVKLFNEDGSPSPLTNQALEFCTSYYRHHAITLNFTAALLKYKLLVPYQSQVTLKSGRKAGLSGFSMIDEKMFNALSDEVFLEFRSKGWLPFIYLALASASNWNRLSALAEA